MADPTPDAPIVTHRDTLITITPWWLHGFIGLRVIYAIGVHLDTIGEQLVQGVRRRFPGFDAQDSLGVIGRDRRIRRGRNEPDASYAIRLRRWWDDHARRGGPYAMLTQLFHHYAVAPYAIDLVYFNGTAYMLATSGAITRGSFSLFAPDALTTKLGRWWLFFHWPSVPPGDGIWSSPGVWDDGGVWDSGLTPNEVADLRLIPNEWGNGHSRGLIVLLAPGFDAEDYTTAGNMVRIAAD